MKQSFVSVVAIVALGLAGMACSSSSTSNPAGENLPIAERKPFKDVTPAEASVGTGSGGIQFIDVRGEAEFEARHAPNSVNVPLAKLSEDMPKMDASKPTYVICEVGLRSEDAAAQLAAAGFTDVRHVKGGLAAWVKAGLPVVQE